jgi:predicted RNA-binding Zn-ribbon protein involved in translation (DUF1610 family)
MTELKDRIERWCREESLEVAVARDDEGGFDCTMSLAEPPLAISVRSVGAPGRLLVACTFDFAVPDDLAEGAERFMALCEGVALARSALIRCTPSWEESRVSAEVAVTVFAEDLTKQLFLTALGEVKKVGLVLERELQAISMSAGVIAEVQAIIEESSALASTVAAGTAGAEEAAPPAPEDVQPAVDEPPPPAAEEMPAIVEESPPVLVEEMPAAVEEPNPAPMPVAPSEAVADRFCTNCGAAIRGRARFCRTCGAPLEDE